MTTLFVKSKLDRAEDDDDDNRPIKFFRDTENGLNLDKTLNCFQWCASKPVTEEQKEEEKIQGQMDRRRTVWMSIAGDKEYTRIPSQTTSSRLVLKTPGYSASLATKSDSRIPIFFQDVQQFFILPLLPPQRYQYYTTNWIDIVRRDEIFKSLIIIVHGAGLHQLREYKTNMVNLRNAFHSCFEVIMREDTVIDELSVVLQVAVEHEHLVDKFGCMDAALPAVNDINCTLATVFPIIVEKNVSHNVPDNSKDKFSRTRLLLTASQMVGERYPIPVPGLLRNTYADHVMTKEKYLPVHESSPMFSLSCERSDKDEITSGLYRVTLIDEKYNALYDHYVLPYNKTFQRRKFSGYSMQMLLDVKTRIQEAQRQIKLALTPDAILLGESLREDLNALKLMHPYVIDTSSIFNFTGTRRWKTKLKDVALHYLDRNIDGPNQEHFSTVYSIAAMELVRLKLAHNIQFGDRVLTVNQDKHILWETEPEIHKVGESVDNVVEKKHEIGAVLGNEPIIKNYIDLLNKKQSTKDKNVQKVRLIPCSTNNTVVSNIKKLINTHYMTMAHLSYGGGKEYMTINNAIQLDKWVRYIWKECPSETLVSMLFTGDIHHKGVLFINMKE